MLPYDEIIDELDDNGTVIRPVSRAELMATGSKNYRLASVLVRTRTGDFIMFRRAYDKKVFPGLFGAVGGCAQTGETFEQAFMREVEEEVGLDVTHYPWRLLGYTTPKDDNTFGHVALYEVICDSIRTYNSDDFAESRIFSFEELKQLCTQKEHVTHNMPILFKKFYLGQ